MSAQRAALALLALLASSCGGGGGGGAVGALGVSGSATYEDKAYDRKGFTGERPRRPVRGAVVQLVADDDHSVLAASSTDANGAYALSASVAGGRSVHVALVASSQPPCNVDVLNSLSEVYALAGPSFSGGGVSSQDLFAAEAQLGGVFNILDAASRGCGLVLALRPGASFPKLRIFWQAGSNGTFYDGSGIRLLGTTADPDQYDDDIILHEFGHYVEDRFTFSTSPGGDHNPYDNRPEPPALAWSEGFAHWWSAETRGNAGQVDTTATGRSFFELEGPTPGGVTRGAGNEIAVGAILWDVSDPANEGHDRINRKRSKLWEVASVYFRQERPDTTIDTFCDGWIALGLGETSALGAIFRNRDVSCP